MKHAIYSAYDREGHRKYLSQTEGREFLKCSRQLSQSRALFCQTIFYTGMRISEALALTLDDIDTASGVIRVRSLKKRKKAVYRRIPAPDSLIAGLPSLATDPSQRLWAFSRSTGWRTIKAVMTAANITGVQATTKGLRHAFGVRGAMAQIPVSILQNWFGHSQMATTAIYLNVRDGEERTLIAKTWK